MMAAMLVACRVLAALLGVMFAAAVSAAPDTPVRQTQLLPVDEAARHPDFFSFRAGLLAAVARRDAARLLAVVHPMIKNSFGGNDGVDEFRTMWGLDGNGPASPGDRPGPDGTDGIWAELGTVLALGGSFSGDDTFTAPYTFSGWPNDVDGFEHVVLVAANVRVRAAPGVAAPALRSASFEILRLARSKDSTEGWIAVDLGSGRTGYVVAALARSPIDYRAIFSRAAGRWQLVTFVAGD
jgi:hypothetical protein